MIVKTISENGGVTLIEWFEDGQLQRSLVPSKEVSEGGECLHPERGIPYGIDFADYITATVTPADIDKELKNSGVWTADDLLHKPKLVQGAIAAAYGIVLGDLLRNVRRLTTG